MTSQEAVKIVDKIYVDFFKRDYKDYTKIKKINFEYRSYSRWALLEIRQYLLENPNRDAIELLDNFLYLMDKYSCKNEGYSNFIFSIACDIAQFIIDELLIEGMKI